MRKREENIQRQPAQRTGGIQRLRDRHQADLSALEYLHQASKIQQRAAEPVHLVDQHAIDITAFDVRQQLPQRGTFQVRSGVSAIVITRGERGPAGMTLAANVSLGGLPLRLQRVEFLVQTFFG